MFCRLIYDTRVFIILYHFSSSYFTNNSIVDGLVHYTPLLSQLLFHFCTIFCVKGKGRWYVHGIQGDSNLHKEIRCLSGLGNIDNLDVFLDLSYEFSNGFGHSMKLNIFLRWSINHFTLKQLFISKFRSMFEAKYFLTVNTAPTIELSFYDGNEDNSSK